MVLFTFCDDKTAKRLVNIEKILQIAGWASTLDKILYLKNELSLLFITGKWKKKRILYGESVRYCIFDTTKLRHYSQLFDIAGKFVLLAE